jgi:uncharacterized protein
MYIKRFAEASVFNPEFGRQMRFITGPRQCGKTSMAKSRLKQEDCPENYFNWDEKKTRDLYRKEGDFVYGLRARGGKKWVCFDEMHKMPKWKNILKGFFDANEKDTVFLVTGSARLEIFRRSGDSLAGRYFQFRLNPLILAEYEGRSYADAEDGGDAREFVEKSLGNEGRQSAMKEMLNLGPFPEPLIRGEKAFASLWHDNYMERIIKEDMRDLTMVRELEKVVDLVHMMPSRIGSPLSVNSLREDLEMNHATVKKYVAHLSSMYALFLLPPFTANLNRPVKKEKKAYFYDYALIPDEGARFENFVALELLSRVELWNNSGKGKYGLYFVRSAAGKESDFLMTKNNRPYILFEAKLNQKNIESHHKHHAQRLGNIPFVQLTAADGIYRSEAPGMLCVSASRFFG